MARSCTLSLCFLATTVLLLSLLLSTEAAKKPIQEWCKDSKYTLADRDAAVYKALVMLEEKSKVPSNIEKRGHEFLVGLMMMMYRFNNDTIQQKSKQIALDTIARWNKMVPNPVEAFANVTNADKIFRITNMLAMHKHFDPTSPAIPALEKILPVIYKNVDWKGYIGNTTVKSKAMGGEEWTVTGGATYDVEYMYFVHKAGMEDAMGVYYIDVCRKALFAFRQAYDRMSYLKNRQVYKKDFNKYNPFHDLIYLITHYSLSLTGYLGNPALSKTLFAPEVKVLTDSMKPIMKDQKDSDMLGEMVDSLITFGFDYSNEDICTVAEYIMDHQQKDGSWSSEDFSDMDSNVETLPELQWFHSTMASMLGIRDVKYELADSMQLEFPELNTELKEAMFEMIAELLSNDE